MDTTPPARHSEGMAQNFYRRIFEVNFMVCLLCAALTTKAQTLYDPSLGTFPENQGWVFGAFGSDNKVITNNSLFFDTSAANSTDAGWSQVTSADLNRTNGFTLLFTAMVNSETHASTNRAGFSIIVLGDDKHGIELGFWTNTIFAQSDTPLFTHAEDASFTTTNSFVNYALTLLATNYILRANNSIILTGPVRNYTAFNGPINPYSTPNFIFFGDDTTSAAASVNIQKFTLVLPPALTASGPGMISWTGVSNQIYTVQASANLSQWSTVGTSTSSNNSFGFTNSPLPPVQFFRVAFP